MKFNTKILFFCSAVASGLFYGFIPIKYDLVIQQDINPATEFNRKWQEKINSGAKEINQLYTENALKVSVDGALLEGRNQISEYYQTQQYQISEIETTANIIAVSDSTVIYEIGHFLVSDKAYSHLILWRKDGKGLLRELELFALREPTENLKLEINKKRMEWMAVCNAHNTKKLVTKYYANDALYYNHRPMIIGQEAIIEEYDYMNDPNYKLTLNPIIFEMVNESLAFEIGQGSGSYNGNYVLVWQKDETGEWRIFFDSNI